MLRFSTIILLLVFLGCAQLAIATDISVAVAGGDTLKGKTRVGVTTRKLSISPSSINPNYNQVARWNTVDINMYHVDMSSFDDTLHYTLNDPDAGHHFHAPHTGKVTSGFGPRKLFGRKFHKGIDIDLETGDNVVAAMGGKVRIARYSSGYGNFVVISHEGGLETLYGHMSKLEVIEGQSVDAGQVIGLGGSTGQSTGSHLHFELRVFGQQVNPELAINRNGFQPWMDEINVDRTWFKHIAGQRPPLTDDDFHIVAEGESWDSICKMYEMDQEALFDLNELAEDTAIEVGMKVRLD